jgi:hypothetical protein
MSLDELHTFMKQKERHIAEVNRAQAVIAVNGSSWLFLEIIDVSCRQFATGTKIVFLGSGGIQFLLASHVLFILL